MRKIKNPYSPLINFILYVMLLVATPFLLLQNYLQSFIGKLSIYNFELFGITVPYVVIIALIFLITLIITFLAKVVSITL